MTNLQRRRLSMRLGLSSSLTHQTPEEWAGRLSALGCRAVNFPADYTCDPALGREQNFRFFSAINRICVDYLSLSRSSTMHFRSLYAFCRPSLWERRRRKQTAILLSLMWARVCSRSRKRAMLVSYISPGAMPMCSASGTTPEGKNAGYPLL